MNIVLVGMPGAGKSTIGVLLAKRVAFDFIDSDLNIQNKTGESLQETMDRDGYLRLREVEEEVLSELNVKNSVISTGGSAVYGAKAMKHLKKDGIVIFIRASLDELKNRVSNYENRGIARRPDQTFQELFDERELLYNKYADLIVDSIKGQQDSMIEEIIKALRARGLKLEHAI
ncbi:shikimate kinase [Thiospirochaeta perfilievii]|uniref:Shikimate kinase n=1 Tax=Thiospirochaeta perfilievii TaxID=252967 RepID=A0A5C1Q7E6_9SPIO|nr:shikimate kinase [Thiospirochaeta perfilievii]QEN04003.1 shikimate kinase [Thiospirochaeta perfilievii]